MPDMAGQVAIVTGAGGSLGREIALAFGSDGARVVALDLDHAAAESTASAIRLAGGQAIDVACDVTSPEAVAAAFDAALTEFGRVDVVVNNAGIFNFIAFAEEPLEGWKRVFAVNVEGPLLTTQAAARVMTAQEPLPGETRRGKIINITSAAATVGRPFLPSYGASKAALNHLSKTSAAALGPMGICTVLVLPTGHVVEGMSAVVNERVAASEGKTLEDFVAGRAAGAPNGTQSMAELAGVVRFVAASPDMSLNGMMVTTAATSLPM